MCISFSNRLLSFREHTITNPPPSSCVHVNFAFIMVYGAICFISLETCILLSSQWTWGHNRSIFARAHHQLARVSTRGFLWSTEIIPFLGFAPLDNVYRLNCKIKSNNGTLKIDRVKCENYSVHGQNVSMKCVACKALQRTAKKRKKNAQFQMSEIQSTQTEQKRLFFLCKFILAIPSLWTVFLFFAKLVHFVLFNETLLETRENVWTKKNIESSCRKSLLALY